MFGKQQNDAQPCNQPDLRGKPRSPVISTISAMTILRLVRTANTISQWMGIVAPFLFLLYWPAANLYWFIAIGLCELYKSFPSNDFALWNPGVLSIFMVFMTPLWALSVMSLYYAGITLSVLSLRPFPILLAIVAWLSLRGDIPSGHVGWKNNGTGGLVFALSETLDWKHPILYSLLSLLVALKYIVAKNDAGNEHNG